MKTHNLTEDGIIKSEKRITTCKTRIISASHHMLRVDEEEIDEQTDSSDIGKGDNQVDVADASDEEDPEGKKDKDE